MKKLLFILIVFVSVGGGMSFEFGNVPDKKVNYKVVKVNGQIQFVKTGADMKRGDI